MTVYEGHWRAERKGGVLGRKISARAETRLYKKGMCERGRETESLRDEIFEMMKEIVSVEAERVLGYAVSSRLWGRVLSRWLGSLVPACFMALTACQ